MPVIVTTEAETWLRNSEIRCMRRVRLCEINDELSRFLRETVTEEIVITRDGRPAGLLTGFGSDDDWFDYRLENDPRFLLRVEQARKSLREGYGVRIEDVTTGFE
jgi:hypothetical protein